MIVRAGVSLYLRLFMEFRVWGREHIPEGPKIFCANHFSSTDTFFVITLMNEPVHMVVGPGFKVPGLRFILKQGEQINALPEHRASVIDEACKYLSRGESVFIFPEGDLNNQDSLRKFYHGMARIAKKSNCPIVPIGVIAPKRYVKEKDKSITVNEVTYRTLMVMTGKYFANIGTPMSFAAEDNVEGITEQVRERITYLINDIKQNKFWS